MISQKIDFQITVGCRRNGQSQVLTSLIALQHTYRQESLVRPTWARGVSWRGGGGGITVSSARSVAPTAAAVVATSRQVRMAGQPGRRAWSACAARPWMRRWTRLETKFLGLFCLECLPDYSHLETYEGMKCVASFDWRLRDL